MSFFSKLVAPYRKGEKNFERARAAELRKDFDQAENYFEAAAKGFDEHLAEKEDAGQEARPSHLVMAGICYTRLGRNEDALRVLDACIERKDIPDAFLHAGYAAAKLEQIDLAIDYWSRYPAWAEQPYIANALKEQVKAIRNHDAPDLQAACETVAQAVHRQDKANAKAKSMTRGKQIVPRNRGY